MLRPFFGLISFLALIGYGIENSGHDHSYDGTLFEALNGLLGIIWIAQSGVNKVYLLSCRAAGKNQTLLTTIFWICFIAPYTTLIGAENIFQYIDNASIYELCVMIGWPIVDIMSWLTWTDENSERGA